MPLAPALFSTTKGWPVLSSMYLPTSRAVMSPEPPGAKGTTIWTGLLGHVSASAFRRGAGRAARAGSARTARRESDMRNGGMCASLMETHRMDSAWAAALPCAHVKVWKAATDRHQGRRFHPRDRGAARLADPVRHGRRSDQDREPRRR